jgi:hypothetical protein
MNDPMQESVPQLPVYPRRRVGFYVRRCVVIAFYVACIVIVAAAVFAIGALIFLPFPGFDGSAEFADLPGAVAKRRLGDSWPPSVDASSVDSVSYTGESSRDSYSSWYRIRLEENAALAWMDYVHAQQERSAKKPIGRGHEAPEGVRRTVVGPPPLHRQTGVTPDWWSPPPIDFRATEVMLWYADYYSGVGRATYSGFDAETNTLWVYDYACQHDKLWPHGKLPDGVPIPLIAK